MRQLILSLLFAAALAYGAQAGEPEAEPAEQQTTEPTGSQEASLPEAGSLPDHDPGDAFENFRPSEEISADKAVKFPVDI